MKNSAAQAQAQTNGNHISVALPPSRTEVEMKWKNNCDAS
jgi:hypothetical protein